MPVRTFGRYTLLGEIAAGGMAVVHFGRLRGDAGFERTVAIKRLHESLARDAEFAAMMADEARLSARVRHPNVVPTLDVVSDGSELLVVMEYVHGESLARLARVLAARDEAFPLPVATGIVAGVLHGLHAAHEAKSEQGRPLRIVHRDVSPQNILVGIDGIARVLDFGVAKAAGRLHTTRDGRIKGKLAYMAPEQILSEPIDARADGYAAAVILWELLAGRRLFARETDGATMHAALNGSVEPPSTFRRDVPRELDAVVLRALARDPAARFPTALEQALAIERAVVPATAHQIGLWVGRVAAGDLERRACALAAIEAGDAGQAAHAHETFSHAGGGEATQTEIPVQPPTQGAARSPSRTSRSWAGGAALGAAGLTLAVVAAARFVPTRGAAIAASSAPAIAPRASTEPEPAPAVVADALPGIPSGAPSASPAAPSSTAPGNPPPRAAARAPRAPSVHPPRTRPANDPCDPPYVIDPSGVKIAKPTCL